jgi:hypothetical protein
MIAGTPTFVAPEQAQGEHIDARADQPSASICANRQENPAEHTDVPVPRGSCSTASRPVSVAVETAKQMVGMPSVEFADQRRNGHHFPQRDRMHPDERSMIRQDARRGESNRCGNPRRQRG